MACAICTRSNVTATNVTEYGRVCTWCARHVKRGKTVDEIQTLFLEDTPRARGKMGRKLKPLIPIPNYPIVTMIPVWKCSDGTEFGMELDASRHELELWRKAARSGDTNAPHADLG